MKFFAIATILLAEFALAEWAGLVYGDNSFTGISGSLLVPTPSIDGSGKAWIGVDAQYCSDFFQAGINWRKSGSTIQYTVYYWWPYGQQYGVNVVDIPISAGDSIALTINADSPSTKTFIIQNQTKNQSFRKVFSNVNTNTCGVNVEWIVEDNQSGIGTFLWAAAYALSDDKEIAVDGTIQLQHTTVLNGPSFNTYVGYTDISIHYN